MIRRKRRLKSVQSQNGREVSTKVLRRISAGGDRLVAAWEKLRWWKVDWATKSRRHGGHGGQGSEKGWNGDTLWGHTWGQSGLRGQCGVVRENKTTNWKEFQRTLPSFHLPLISGDYCWKVCQSWRGCANCEYCNNNICAIHAMQTRRQSKRDCLKRP